MTRSEALEIRKKVLDGEAVARAGGIREEVSQSDKLGSDWISTYVNDILVKQEYVAQENPAGVQDNPIVYSEGVPLINNAFYLRDGAMYVWMGEWIEW